MGNFFKDALGYLGAPAGALIGFGLGGPAGAAIGAGIGAGASGYAASQEALQGAREQNAMTEYYYRNKYQMMVNDLRLAGLNPILAAQGGFNPGTNPTFVNPQAQAAQLKSAIGTQSVNSALEAHRLHTESISSTSQKTIADSTQQLNKILGNKYDQERRYTFVKLQHENILKEISQYSKSIRADEATIKEIERIRKSIFRNTWIDAQKAWHELTQEMPYEESSYSNWFKTLFNETFNKWFGR